MVPLPTIMPMIAGVKVKPLTIKYSDTGVNITVAVTAESVSTPIPPPLFLSRKFQLACSSAAEMTSVRARLFKRDQDANHWPKVEK